MILADEYGVILSVDDPKRALTVLRSEFERRTVYAWRMSNGKFIDIKNMSLTHLENVIAMLEKMVQEAEIIQENLGEIQ